MFCMLADEDIVIRVSLGTILNGTCLERQAVMLSLATKGATKALSFSLKKLRWKQICAELQ